jgi:iron-sulfur cluster repair protein YtfE (RIC family)
MKRHESLAPLSREHHGALILAQLIKRNAPAYQGLPTDTEEKVNYAINFYKTDLIQHFSKEEIILEKVKHADAVIAKLVEEIITEHAVLTSRFLSLNSSGDKTTALDEIGHLLQTHIRKEERVLFPLIQERCNEEILNYL